ncbi:hypothetical protein G5714_007772 [Onychostoma macrolepis]|uniref:Ubiquitin-like protease family profile domain-containing protein n=1 Tax=Onychostoma macrolepis TaxID=369639 RepID=A0A7J6CUD5_9TELE|nr:hypothetical protein G5714_007772 [Onychostoma macrolepis]
MNVDGKSIDLKDDKGRFCPKINKDHLVHFLEEYPSKVPKLSDSFPVAVSSALTNPPGFTPAATTQPPVCAATTQPPALLQEIWARKKGGTLCSKIGPYKLFTWDIEHLRPGELLESEVINAYLSYLIKNYAGKAYVLDSFQATSIWQGNPSSMSFFAMNPGAYDVLIGTVNENNHWTLLVIYPKKLRILYLNSLGENQSKLEHCKKAVSKFMATKGNLGEKWECGKVPHCLQKDDNSRGVFVCKFAEAILKGGNLEFESTVANINVIRQDIGLCLLQETEDLSELCLACGDKYPYTEDTEDSWVCKLANCSSFHPASKHVITSVSLSDSV